MDVQREIISLYPALDGVQFDYAKLHDGQFVVMSIQSPTAQALKQWRVPGTNNGGYKGKIWLIPQVSRSLAEW